MKVNKAQLLMLLADITRTVEADDSFEGSIGWIAINRDNFAVYGAYRVGNSQGQGGMVLLGSEEEARTEAEAR